MSCMHDSTCAIPKGAPSAELFNRLFRLDYAQEKDCPCEPVAWKLVCLVRYQYCAMPHCVVESDEFLCYRTTCGHKLHEAGYTDLLPCLGSRLSQHKTRRGVASVHEALSRPTVVGQGPESRAQEP